MSVVVTNRSSNGSVATVSGISLTEDNVSNFTEADTSSVDI